MDIRKNSLASTVLVYHALIGKVDYKMKIKITTDSTGDLSPEQLQKYNISVIPLYITKNELSFRDGIDITPEQIFEDAERTGELYKTAAINISDYICHFSEYLKEYDAVIHLDIGSGFSTCYQNACIAAESFENIYVVDSHNLTVGTGTLAIDAAVMAAEGLSPQDIVNKLNRTTAKIDTSFILDKLNFLHMGGRCSGIAALGANLLNLKPCIEVVDGKMVVGKKYRGNLDKVAYNYAKNRLSNIDSIDPRRIFIVYTRGIDEITVSSVRKAVKEAGIFNAVLECYAGCTISSHCGPNTIGIIFYKK